ncbi:hypothetical protein VNO80_29164 [Phaseolus coccineus]|uniref:Uncharacterized protein n=1 Tax=Phaseolus coccineus TaxID=3886 RepID=A0AAN9LDV5_PHACN
MSFLETVVCKFVDLVVGFVDFGVLFDKVHFPCWQCQLNFSVSLNANGSGDRKIGRLFRNPKKSKIQVATLLLCLI